MGDFRKFWVTVRDVYLRDTWKYGLYSMLAPPWKRGSDKERNNTWFPWLLGWSWALAGMVAGALVAPSLVNFAGLADTSYQDWLVIGVALVSGFVVQLLGWTLVAYPLTVDFLNKIGNMTDEELQKVGLVRLQKSQQPVKRNRVLIGCWLPITMLLPLAGVSYGVYRYLTWIGPGQQSVTIAFVGGLLVKTFLIPFIKGIVTGALFRWFVNWLRGGKDQKNG